MAGATKTAEAGATTLASAAYLRLRRDIIETELAAGSRLHTRQLCARYDVGLTPIREALSRLSSEKLVLQSDQRGFAVAPLNEQDLGELTRTRIWLNETGLRQSIAEGDRAWEEQAVLSLHRLSRVPCVIEDGTVRNPVWEDAHRDFHGSLVAGCQSTWLIGFCEQLFDAYARYRNLAPFTVTVRPDHLLEHRAIMEAAVDRDADSACALMRTHFEISAAIVREHLRSLQAAERPAAR